MKIQQSAKIDSWMKSHKLPPAFYKRILEFTRLKRHEKDLFEGSEILDHLPKSLQCEI